LNVYESQSYCSTTAKAWIDDILKQLQ
jgi:hypothetical protein